MKNFDGKVVVITGAASGIGFALANKFAELGTKIVLADIEEPALADAAKKLEAKGAQVITAVTDVSKAADVDALAKKTLDAFGAVHVLCNNAGIVRGGTSWQMPIEDYAWHLGVNLWGVIHGIRTFIPIFLEQGEEAHVINTGSMASLSSTPFTPAYCMSKHAVISLSECLYHELQLTNAKIKVSVLCPAAVITRIDKAERNRPDHFQPSDQGDTTIPDYVSTALTENCQGGITPEEMAEQTLRAIAEDRFYILPEGGDAYRWKKLADLRLDDIRLGRNPTFIDPNQIKEDA